MLYIKLKRSVNRSQYHKPDFERVSQYTMTSKNMCVTLGIKMSSKQLSINSLDDWKTENLEFHLGSIGIQLLNICTILYWISLLKFAMWHKTLAGKPFKIIFNVTH